MWRPEDNFLKLVFSFHWGFQGLESSGQGLCGKSLYPLSHPYPAPRFSGPCSHFPFTQTIISVSSPPCSIPCLTSFYPWSHRLVDKCASTPSLTHTSGHCPFCQSQVHPARIHPTHLCILPSSIAPVHHLTIAPLTSHSSAHRSSVHFLPSTVWFPLSSPSDSRSPTQVSPATLPSTNLLIVLSIYLPCICILSPLPFAHLCINLPPITPGHFPIYLPAFPFNFFLSV